MESRAILKEKGKAIVESSLDSFWHKSDVLPCSNQGDIDNVLYMLSNNHSPITFTYVAEAYGPVMYLEEMLNHFFAVPDYQFVYAKTIELGMDILACGLCVDFIISPNNTPYYVEYRGDNNTPNPLYPMVTYERVQANEYVKIHLQYHKDIATGDVYCIWSPIEKFKAL